MKYESSIFVCLEYIEKNIKEDLTAKDISYKVGYSEFHFSRIFKAQMGVSLMEYVKERKLICASKEIFSGKKIIDVSEEYGYKTHSGFSKAFKNKFGFTPTQHLIYAINMIDYLNKEIGDGDNMSKDLNKANVFIKSTIDFTDQEVLYKQLMSSLKDKYSYDDLKIIEKAYKLACKAHEGQYRKSGEPYIIHPLCVAIILSEIEVDKDSIIAGLLHDVILEDTHCILDEIELEFSNEVAILVDEVTRFNLKDLNTINKDESNIDSRVILIKLADRLHNMRTIMYTEPSRYEEKAKETIEIFSPIAAKLNISKIKTELDDLSLKYI